MKLRNIILATAAVAFSSAALAANTGAIAQGGTYVGLAGGWGKVDNDTRTIDVFHHDEARADAASTTGGFSGRVYLGYLAATGGNFLFGPELGYSYYANNTYDFSASDSRDLKVKESAYGIDLLLNATYMLTNAVNLSVKPGVQYAFQKVSATGADRHDLRSASVQDDKILPEINLAANWQAFANQPFYLGASYQYVWGSDARDSLHDVATYGYAAVTSRQVIALNLEYLF